MLIKCSFYLTKSLHQTLYFPFPGHEMLDFDIKHKGNTFSFLTTLWRLLFILTEPILGLTCETSFSLFLHFF